MIKHQFSDFSYAVNKDSAKKGHKEVLVCFMYNGTEVLKKVYIPEKAGTAYIFEAKQIIDKEMRDGSLAAYAHKFVGRKNKEAAKPKAASSSSSNKTEYVPLPPKKGLKIAFVIVCVLFVAAAAVAVLFMLKKPPVGKVSITFDGKGGNWNTTQTVEYSKTITVDKGTKWSEITNKPESPKMDGNTFKFWTVDNHLEIKDDYVFESDTTTVSAIYETEVIDEIKFDSGTNGHWATPGSQIKTIKNVVYGTTFKDLKATQSLEIVAADNFEFKYFSDGTPNGSPLGDSYKFTTNDKQKTFTAQYVQVSSFEVLVTADANGGNWKTASTDLFATSVFKNTTWADNKDTFEDELVDKPGHTHSKWEYFTNNEWAELTDNVKFVETNTQIRPVYTANQLEITFNAGDHGTIGGQASKTISVSYGDTFGQHSSEVTPTPDQDFSFTHFTYGSPETKLSDTYVFTGDVTEFTAQYGAAGSIYLIVDGNKGLVDGEPLTLITIATGDTWETVTQKLDDVTVTEPAGEMKEFDEWKYFNGADWIVVPTEGDLPVGEEVIRIRADYVAQNIKVTFNNGDGTWFDGSEDNPKVFESGEVKYGDRFDKFMQTYEEEVKVIAPIRHVFAYFTVTDSDDTSKIGKIVSDDYILTNNEEYTATYIRVTSDYISVAIDPQGGLVDDSAELILLDNTLIGTTWKQILTAHPELAEIVPPTGFNFVEWQYFNGSDWAKLEDTYVFNVNTRVKAAYESTTIPTITFSAGKGTWADGTEGIKVRKNANYGITLDEIDGDIDLSVTPSDDRHVFTYFSIIPDVGDPIVIGRDYSFTESETVVAQYASITEAVNLTFDAQEGTIHGQDEFNITFPSGITWAEIFAACPSIPDDPLKEFDFYSFDDSTVAIPTPIDPADTCSIEDNGKTIYAYYKDVTTQKFENDSWLNLSKNATGHTLNELLAIYNEADGGEEFTTFVGKTKTIKISDSLSYEVMVIGEDADETADGQTATLTFQFTKLVTGGINYAEEKSDYTTSNLKAYLDDYINYLPADLQQSIVNVKKDTYSHESKAPVTTTGNYLFALSMSEMNKTISPVTGEQIGYSEGNPYAYYTQPSAIYQRLYKAPTPYWTRSPAPIEPTVHNCAYAFDDQGELISIDLDLTVNNAYGVLPAFCIGAHA